MSNHSSEATPLELFRLELEERVEPVNDGLLQLEADPGSLDVCDSLIRSLHSVKGAAGIVELPTLVTVAHRLEDFFVAVKNGKAVLSQQAFAVGFRCVDLFQVVSRLPAAGIRDWLVARAPELDELVDSLIQLLPEGDGASPAPLPSPAEIDNLYNIASEEPSSSVPAASDRVVRVEPENLNRIMALSGEMLVEAKWLQPFADSLTLLKDRQKTCRPRSRLSGCNSSTPARAPAWNWCRRPAAKSANAATPSLSGWESWSSTPCAPPTSPTGSTRR